jgi:resuscitation-promoting factor RpfA
MARHRLRRRTPILAALTAAGASVGLVLAAAPASADVFANIRQCESGGNYATNTGNGYYGAYQFDRGTWRGMGYKGRPDRAEPRFQDAATRKLHDHRGWAPWPSCSRKEHLH